MLLDLYVTHWTEDWKIGSKGFDMLALQRMVDWDQVRITLVHDGPYGFPESYFLGYPFQVRQVELEHGGIAAARNWCIDDAKAEWIKWNDFDDLFANIYALRDLMHALQHGQNYDLLWWRKHVEDDTGGKAPICRMETKRDPVVLHNKAIRTGFLREHGIRFQEFLTWCEDSAFLALVEMEIDHRRIGEINSSDTIYCSIARDGSLCNRPGMTFANLQSFFHRHVYVQEEMRKHGRTDGYLAMTVRVMYDSYYTLRKAGITEDTGAFEREVREYWAQHRTDMARLTDGLIREVALVAQREKIGDPGTFSDFLAWLRTL